MLIEGRDAPDFTLPDQDGNAVSLHGLRGKWVVVYFYPRADTPGCTTQACGVRDRSADYEKAGATVLGISPDPVSAVKKFADKNSLRFHLLADEAHSVAEDWGVWAEKSMYGKKYWGVVRATFIIDPQGKVAQVFPEGLAEDARRPGARRAPRASRWIDRPAARRFRAVRHLWMNSAVWARPPTSGRRTRDGRARTSARRSRGASAP